MRSDKNKTLILSGTDINKIVRHFGLNAIMDDLIDRMIIAFENFDPEETIVPIRAGFNYEEPETGLVEWMPLYNKGRQVVIKVVGYHPGNPAKFGLPTIISTISAYDTSTGHLKGIMDGVFLTALRTGASSAVASRVMGHPESTTLGLIGCGAQSITQLHGLSRVYNLKRILFFDIDPDTMSSFETRCNVINLDAEFVSTSIEEVVTNADILCTATSIEVGAGPLFSNIETKPFLHINAVGSDFPGKTELPVELLKQSFVCPDFYEQAVLEGECQQLQPDDIAPDIIEVIQNQAVYNYVREQRTIFDSTGYSLEDQVVMELFMEYADQLNLGQKIDLENMPTDAKNPYQFLNISELTELLTISK